MDSVDPLVELFDSDRKYITFKREELYTALVALVTDHGVEQEVVAGSILDVALHDAVVIRRQDLFASPALATYASCISMVAAYNKNADLLKIADYFQRQSELAAEEGWKLPDV